MGGAGSKRLWPSCDSEYGDMVSSRPGRDAADAYIRSQAQIWRRWNAIRVIAVALICLGLLAVVDVITAAANNSLNINLAVLMLPTGIYLWRGSSVSRRAARIWCWLAMILIAGLSFLAMAGMAEVSWMGRPASGSEKVLVISLLLGVVGLVWWADRILRRAGLIEQGLEPA